MIQRIAKLNVARILYFTALFIYALGCFLDFWPIYCLIFIACFILAFISINEGRKDLKAAVFYCRRAVKKKFSYWLRLIISLLLVVLMVFFMREIGKFLNSSIDYFKHLAFPLAYPSLILILFLASLTNYYNHFNASIRSYVSGIKLPGKTQEIIPWNQIERMSNEFGVLKIQANGAENQFEIDPRDLEDLNGMVAAWSENGHLMD